jgi:hypothetical protein
MDTAGIEQAISERQKDNTNTCLPLSQPTNTKAGWECIKCARRKDHVLRKNLLGQLLNAST